MIARNALRPVVGVLTAASLAAGLAGCALLSSPDPVQTYRFGMDASSASAPMPAAPAAQPVAVVLRRLTLPEASRGDRMLGVTGTEVAYIKGARWVSPAETLLDDSLRGAFTARQGRVRLLGGRDNGAASRVLGVEVTAFEARYTSPGAAPDIVIVARARLTALPDRAVVEERVFTVTQPASANRVASIVEAFDIATRDLNAQVVEWTETRAR